MTYKDFIDGINCGWIKQIDFYLEGYGHYRNCSIGRYREKIYGRDVDYRITCVLTKNHHEDVSFFDKFDEKYKLFNIKSKGKFTLKEVWSRIVITKVEYFSIFKSTKNTRPIIDGSIKYIRSDVPTVVSEKEKEWLVTNKITTIIDLRSDAERQRKPCGLFGDDRFKYYCRPVFGGDSVPESCELVVRSYINMVDSSFLETVDLILRAESNVLYFCNAGKDRTGVLSAVLLQKMGATSEQILCDYMKSADNLRDMLLDYAKQNPSVSIDVITPHEEYILDFLTWFMAENG